MMNDQNDTQLPPDDFLTDETDANVLFVDFAVSSKSTRDEVLAMALAAAGAVSLMALLYWLFGGETDEDIGDVA